MSRGNAGKAKRPWSDDSRLQDTIDTAIDQARLLIRQLQAPGGEENTLVAALSDLAVSTSAKSICEFKSNLPESVICSSKAAVGLFRIAQTAVECALQRPNVTKITILLTTSARGLTLEIHNNARPCSGRPGSILSDGVLLMKSHAQVLGGELRTRSTRQGTIVTCTCPNPYRRKAA